MDDDLNNLSEQEKTLSPALYANFDEVACHVMGSKQKQELRHLLGIMGTVPAFRR